MISLAELTIKDYIKTQLNERCSETEYNVLYPETIAEQVIESESQQFVSAADKEKWNSLLENSLDHLSYKGDYDSSTTYYKYDVVRYKIDTTNYKFYICITASESIRGQLPTNLSHWLSISDFADKAIKSDTIKVVAQTTNHDYNLLMFKENGDGTDYEDLASSTLLFNPSTNVLKIGSVIIDGTNGTVTALKFIGDLEGTADKALKADEAEIANKYVQYDSEGNRLNESSFVTIDSAIKRLEEAIEHVAGGGVSLKKLKFTKDGGTAWSEYDGTSELTIDIKQSYSPEDINDLLETSKKIKEKWLPDFLLGQLKYGGSINANGTITSASDKVANGTSFRPNISTDPITYKGFYFIAADDITFSMTFADNLQGVTLNKGDWIVCNGESGWVKIDNTDAVTMVNGQIGSVETYKGNHAFTTQYYKGDIVQYNNALYLCIENTIQTYPTDTTKWKIFGQVYTADNEGIEIDGTTIKHKVNVTTDPAATSVTLGVGQSFATYELVRDKFGHVIQVKQKNISLDEAFTDTVRPINLNGTEILASNVKTALNLKSSTWININNSNGAVTFSHKENNAEITLQTAGGTVGAGGTIKVPSFTVDKAGHITAGEMVDYTIGLADIAHQHFNIVTDGNTKTIGAFSASDYNSLADKNLKFYLGDVVPTSTSQMNFNGIFNATALKQKGNAVLDSTTKTISGVKYNGTSIESTYENGNVVLGDSGVIVENGENATVYSAVAVNKKGIVTAGGHIVEFGTDVNEGPSDSLVVGGLFFRKLA